MNFELLLNVYLYGLVPAGILAGIIWEHTERTNYQFKYSKFVFLCTLFGLIIFWPFWLGMVIYGVIRK